MPLQIDRPHRPLSCFPSTYSAKHHSTIMTLIPVSQLSPVASRLAIPLSRPCISHIAKTNPTRQQSKCYSTPAKPQVPSSQPTGSKEWKALSGAQKVVRTTQTGASLAMIAVGLVLTVRAPTCLSIDNLSSNFMANSDD